MATDQTAGNTYVSQESAKRRSQEADGQKGSNMKKLQAGRDLCVHVRLSLFQLSNYLT